MSKRRSQIDFRDEEPTKPDLRLTMRELLEHARRERLKHEQR